MKISLFILALFLLGAGYPSAPSNAGDPVKVGLLIPSASSTAAKQGAELAIDEANQNGGYRGRPFRLVVRSMEGPWGTGSKQAVDLIFNEEVWAIMGSHDGRNAHLVEQAAVKTRVVFLSAWAGDPTLSQAFVPIYFSCIPNDLQQADELISEIWKRRKLKDIVIVHDNDYDAMQAFSAFQRESGKAGMKMPVVIVLNENGANTREIAGKTEHAQGILLFCSAKNAALFAGQSHGSALQRLFGNVRLLDENMLTNKELDLLKQKMWVPFNTGFNETFVKKFNAVYKRSPGIMTACAYDGMNVLIKAIYEAGLDREKIRASLAGMNIKGVTGNISFDAEGNRQSH